MSALAAHADHVIRTAECSRAAAQSRLSASWRRSLVTHRLDPFRSPRSERCSDHEVSLRVDAAGRLLQVAGEELDVLFAQVGQSGCAVLLTDQDGVVLDQRINAGDMRVFDGWGLRIGSVWSEAVEGTNGIGTCLVEERPVTIHREQHFLCRNIGMSCIDAPVFGHDGALVGALNVSSARVDRSRDLNCLLAAAVARTAHMIETALFRAAYPHERLVVERLGAQPHLLAVDGDDLVVGASRSARRSFNIPFGQPVTPRPANDLLGQDQSGAGMQGAERAVLRRALVRADGNATAAARALGISRATLYRRMKRTGLSDCSRDSSQI